MPANTVEPMPINWITVAKHAAETGYTEDAINTKIRDGVWLEGKVWKHAPDGRRLISVEGYNAWVEQEATDRSGKRRKRHTKSISTTAANAAKSASSSSPAPLTAGV